MAGWQSLGQDLNKEVTQQAIAASTGATVTSLGGDGGTAPPVGTGVRGWLRSTYELLQSLLNAINPYRGTTSYLSGANGSATIPNGARVVSIACHATLAGSLTILGGSSIPVPAGNGFSDGWSGFVGPGNIVFTGTDSYYVVLNQ